eukprot:1180229-Prorocentrum_minimum.AAC.1
MCRAQWQKVVVLESGSTTLCFKNEDIERLGNTLADAEASVEQIQEALRKLSSYYMSVKVLLDTKVGKAVKRLRKHSNVLVAKTAHNLVEKWTTMINEQHEATGAAATHMQQQMKTLLDPPPFDGSRLPSPACPRPLLTNSLPLTVTCVCVCANGFARQRRSKSQRLAKIASGQFRQPSTTSHPILEVLRKGTCQGPR